METCAVDECTYSISNDAKPADVLRYFFTAFVYAFSIGCLAHGVMAYPWAWSMSKPAGASASQFRGFYKQSLSVSVPITMILGGFIISYEATGTETHFEASHAGAVLFA